MPVQVSAPASIRRILFATDFSPHSSVALQHAAAEARRHNAKLFVTHVLPHEPRLAVSFDIVPGVYDEEREEAKIQFRRLENCGVLDGIAHECLLPSGELWPRLSEAIRKYDIQMIVLATRGRGGVAKLLLGSAAESVFRQACCPVMTIGPQVRPPEKCAKTILCPTALLHNSESALPHARTRACMPEGRLILVHALAPEMVAPDTPRARLLEEATHRLRVLVEHDTGSPHPEFVVDFGSPAELILRTAAQTEADLIIMGVHAPGALRESPRLPWSTAHQVVCRAHCPVLTVRACS